VNAYMLKDLNYNEHLGIYPELRFNFAIFLNVINDILNELVLQEKFCKSFSERRHFTENHKVIYFG